MDSGFVSLDLSGTQSERSFAAVIDIDQNSRRLIESSCIHLPVIAETEVSGDALWECLESIAYSSLCILIHDRSFASLHFSETESEKLSSYY